MDGAMQGVESGEDEELVAFPGEADSRAFEDFKPMKLFRIGSPDGCPGVCLA
jgi:hypothetical protein